jgi:hypothetical protein
MVPLVPHRTPASKTCEAPIVWVFMV